MTNKESIIVVGPDRVGKTTICNRISEMTGVPIFKCPSEKEIFKNGGVGSLTFDYTLTHFLQQTGYRMISDRGYPCEWVYSTIFKRSSDWGKLGEIDARHSLIGTKIVFIHSSEVPREEDDLVPSEFYGKIVDGYRLFCDLSLCDVYEFDSKDMLQAFYDGEDISNDFSEMILNQINWDMSKTWCPICDHMHNCVSLYGDQHGRI